MCNTQKFFVGELMLMGEVVAWFETLSSVLERLKGIIKLNARVQGHRAEFRHVTYRTRSRNTNFLIVIFDVFVGTEIRTPRRIRSEACRCGYRRAGLEVFSSVLCHLLIFLDQCTGIHAKVCYGELIAGFCLFQCYTRGRDAMTNIYRNMSWDMTVIRSWKTRFKV
jgi:hypothetical protein